MFLNLLRLLAATVWFPIGALAMETIQDLDVRKATGGGVVAQATIYLAASPAVVQEVLTDYEHWPELFTVSMRMARIERFPDRVVTDIYLKHGFLSGERRLLCEHHVLPGGMVRTTLLEGDFRRYSRNWKLTANGAGGGTKAEFRLEVDVDTVAPDWIVGMVLKQELERHFEILKTKTEERGGLQKGR